jgi:hypothetical protein
MRGECGDEKILLGMRRYEVKDELDDEDQRG